MKCCHTLLTLIHHAMLAVELTLRLDQLVTSHLSARAQVTNNRFIACIVLARNRRYYTLRLIFQIDFFVVRVVC
jgi:hypothetical protein